MDKQTKYVSFPKHLRMNDDRAKVTEQEKEDFLKRYFDGTVLRHFPKQQKRKLILLQHIMENFDERKEYREIEVNEILMVIYSDYITLRRYLLDYGFLDRTKDGLKYWVRRDEE